MGDEVLSIVEALPAAALTTVFSQLSERDLCQARLACRHFHEVSVAAVAFITPRAPLHDVLQKISPDKLQQLDLRYVRLDAAQVACFARLTALRQLDLTIIPCYEAVRTALVEQLADSCQCLTRLEIASVTDDIADHLARLTQLRTLSIAGSITDCGLYQLSSLQHLQHLTLSCCDAISDYGLLFLTSLTALVNLQFDSCMQLNDAALYLVGHFTQLTSFCLSLSCEDATSAGLLYLSTLTNLQQLDLSAGPENAASSAVAQLLSTLAQLTRLDLSYAEFVDASVLRAVAGLQELQVLGLSGIQPRSVSGLKYLKRLPRLHQLQLRWTGQLQDSNLSFLPHLATLAVLDLSYCKSITKEGLQRLMWLTQLKQLNLVAVQNEDLSCLSALQQLTGLMVSQLPHSGKCWQHIAGLSQLQSLALRRCMISASNSSGSSSNRSSSSKNSSSSSSADSSSSTPGSNLTLSGAPSSFIDLSQLQQLTALCCYGSTVQPEAVAALQHIPHLELLGLGKCQAVTNAVLASLLGCKSLRKLDLRLRGADSNWGLKGLQLLLDKMPELSAVFVSEVPNGIQQRDKFRILSCPWERVMLPVSRDASVGITGRPRLW